MESSGLIFATRAIASFAAILATLGGALIMIDINPGPGGGRHADWGRAWSRLTVMRWADVPAAAARTLGDLAARALAYWFGRSGDNAMPGALFILIVLIAIPLAALINAINGGSPFLIWFIVAAAAALLVLLFLGELGRAKALGGVIAVFLFVSVLFFVPGYVWISFTGRILNDTVGHAAIASLLIFPLLYIVCHAGSLAAEAFLSPSPEDLPGAGLRRSRAAGLTAAFAAALPAAYLLTFAALLAGRTAVPDAPLPMTWGMLSASLAANGLNLAWIAALLGRRGGRAGRHLGPGLVLAGAGAAVLSVAMLLGADWADGGAPSLARSLEILAGLAAGGGGVKLGPRFWVMHTVFVPLFVVLAAIAGAWLARALAAAAAAIPGGRDGLRRRPLMATGLVLVVAAVPLWLAALGK